MSDKIQGLIEKRKELENQLYLLEKQIYDLETSYLEDSNQNGSILKGFDVVLGTQRNSSSQKKSKRFQAEDRLFSISSVTSPAVDEILVKKDPEAPLQSVSRIRAPRTDHAKILQVRRNRMGPRDAKRARSISELEDEDDGDAED